MDHDLCGLLGNQDFKMTHSLAKLLFKQILEGMAYIHAVSEDFLRCYQVELTLRSTTSSTEISRRPTSSWTDAATL
jgi:serine/threonine-protein kinase BUR1